MPTSFQPLTASQRSLLKVLDAQHVSLTLASVNSNGEPHATRTFFRWEFDRSEPSIVVTVLASSAKLQNIRRRAKVAFNIADDIPNLWLNGHGEAVELDGHEAEEALKSIVDKHPAVEAFARRLPTVLVRILVRDFIITDTRNPDSPPVRVQYPLR